MSISKIMAKELANSGAKFIHGAVKRNIDPIAEWIKWLSYVPESQKSKIQQLESKTVREISLEEIEEIYQYRYQEKMANLFKLYGTNNISEAEYLEVYNYMSEQSIKELMLRKLSKAELSYAKEKIKYFSQISRKELELKIKKEQKIENYNKLSMVDSYILHMLSDLAYAESKKKFDSQLDAQFEKNELMRQKSYTNHKI